MSFSQLPVLRTLVAFTRESARVYQVAADTRSRYRLIMDLFLYRFLGLGGLGMYNQERTVRLLGDVTITYRLNRGDIQSIREVWLEDIYRFPGTPQFSCVFDLGANVGQASLYFAKRYGSRMIVAVEPDPGNAALAQRNLEQNGVAAHVVTAAVGPRDGIAFFSDSRDSNAGHLSDHGREVSMVSVPTLCSRSGTASIDLLKVDIEGAEQSLFTEQSEWLNAVQAIVVEFHPQYVDYPGLVDTIRSQGFARTTPDTFHAHATEVFTRTP